MQGTHQFAVTFKPPAAQAATADHDPYCEALERFAAADPRWRDAIEVASASLDDSARCTLGVLLAGLEAGPMPRMVSYDFGADDEEGIMRECKHMEPQVLSAFGLLSAAKIGLGSGVIAKVQGIVTAIHRRLREAKTRPQ